MVGKINEHLLVPRTLPVGMPGSQKPQATPKKSFAEVLSEKQAPTKGLKISAHAQQRIQSRNIQLSASDMAKMTEAVDEASAKGAKDTLVLMKDMAFVVSAKNRTIVTAMDGESMKNNLFTKIDSAVVI